MSPGDRSLVERALAGERDAFGTLVERYRGAVHGLVLEKVRQPEEAEDLVQDAFSKAYQELGQLEDPRRFAAWLRQIAGNTALEWLRRRARERGIARSDLLPLQSAVASPAEVYEGREISARVWQAIDRLPPEYREVVVLYYVEGCRQHAIGRFLGITRTAVYWRLKRAHRRLGSELSADLLRALGRLPESERQRRDQIMALLPVALLLPMSRPRPRMLWLWRGLFVVGGLGVLGFSVGRRDVLLSMVNWGTAPPNAITGIPVQLEPWKAPDLSVQWDPAHPVSGEVTRVYAAGPTLGDRSVDVVLHYLTDPAYPLDHVVPMQREGEEWVGELTVPSDATVVFFYPRHSADGGDEPQRFDPTVGFETWQQWMQPYRWSFEVTDDSGSPVRGAAEGMATMARHQGEGEEVILQHLEREVRDYPDHFEVYSKIWYRQVTADRESEAVRERVFAEGAALRGRYPDSPEAWNVSASGFDPRRLALLRQLLRRFPEWERADEVFYMMSHSYRSTGDRAGEIRVLEEFLRGYPDSPYVDEAYRRLLALLARVDEDRAAGLADSLIDGTLVVEWSREREAQHRGLFLPNPGAMSPEGHAYSLRFDLHMAEGDTAAARNLAQRLLAADLVHPMPYLRVGSGLAGGATSGLPGGDPPASPEDLAVAESVLTAGRRRATVEDMLGLPSYLINANLPSHAREEYRILHTRQIERVRDSFATQIDRCRRLQRVGAGTGMAEVAR